MSESSNLVETVENPELELAFEFVQNTNRNIFLTGKAGTGKTTFLHTLKRLSPKRMIVVAPTGVAAINAGGVTIHSFFQLPFGPYISTQLNNVDKLNIYRQNIHKFNKNKINIIKSLDLLVIDEISMVRADLLDGIDDVLRKYKNKSKPFGGVQLLMIGDIQQLSPVTKEDEWNILKSIYSSMYFFSSRALTSSEYVSIELKHIYRQRDNDFINILNKVRENALDIESLNELNKRYDPSFTQNIPKGYIILTTHNSKAQKINQNKLEQIKGKTFNFKASIEGDFPENAHPTNSEITFKEGAQVMFIKNDISPEKLFYNGKIGIIKKIDKDTIYVKCESDSDYIAVKQVEWQNVKYSIDEEKKEIKEDIVGTFTQHPLILAWAITIHKSQGLTFEKAIIDANASFAHGQVYVALSRCKTLEGMVLSSKIISQSIVSDGNVQSFSSNVSLNQPSIEILEKAKHEYQKSIIFELFDFTQTKQRLYYCLKLYKENSGSIHVSFYEKIEQILGFMNSEIIEISIKFESQIIKMLVIEPNVERNQILNDRIKKACIYFIEKVGINLIEKIDNISIESDNKSLVKSINEAMEKIRVGLIIKLACLNKCKMGFSVKAYLEVKAKSSIEEPVKKVSKSKDESISTDYINYPELFELLKEWRKAEAEKLGKPHYFVLQLKTLVEIDELLPSNLKELKDISGIGKQKIKAYGNDIIDIINKYCDQNKINRDEIRENKKNKENTIKTSKSDDNCKITSTHKLTYELFKQGKNIEEIAIERHLTTTTIEGHLSKYVLIGELDIFQFIDDKKLSILENAFGKYGYDLLKPIKDELGDKFSYGEIKLSRAHFLYIKGKKN